MRRFTRLLVPLTAAAALLAPVSAQATNTLTWTFAVPCSDPAGATTPLGIGLPTGTYAVTTAGGCVIGYGPYYTVIGPTPCSVPVVGSVPCTSPITVNNIPFFTSISTGAGSDVTGGGVNTTGCSAWYITIDGNCFAAQAGLYQRTVSGPMTVAFVGLAGTYGVNLGELTVTVTWTPL